MKPATYLVRFAFAVAVLALGLAAPLPASAGECAPLYEAEMKHIVDASYTTLYGEAPDMSEHTRLTKSLEVRLPCADFQVTPKLWSRFLVSIAVREHASGGDWQSPLTTALRVDDDVEIPVAKAHPLRSFEPAPPPPPKGPLPEGIVLLKDGVYLHDNVPLDAMHLLQRTNGDGMQTEVIHGPADIPRAFLVPPRAASKIVRARRRKAIHRYGTIGGAALIGVGAAAFGMGLDARTRYNSPGTLESDLLELEKRNDRWLPLGWAFGSAGIGVMAITWSVPW